MSPTPSLGCSSGRPDGTVEVAPTADPSYSMSSLKRTLRAVKIAATDRRIPRPLRGLAALGLAPIPGPFDEALLLIVVIPLVLFYREPLADAWRQANTARPS
jgi:hypothetical protein